MFTNCCSYRDKGSVGSDRSKVEDGKDPAKMFGDHFEGIDVEMRQKSAQKYAEKVATVMSKDTTNMKSGLSVLDPPPIVISMDGRDKKSGKTGGA